MEFRQGDRVEILKGKRQGQIAKVTEVQGTERVLVEFEGGKYEVSYLKEDVVLRTKASKINPLVEDGTVGCTPFQVTGDKKLRLVAHLVKQGKLCPSWPYSCSGECESSKEEKARGQAK
jgi:ribosomal protein L24